MPENEMRLHSDYELISMIAAEALLKRNVVDVKVMYAIRELEERIRGRDTAIQKDQDAKDGFAQKNVQVNADIKILQGRIQAYRDVIRMLKDK